MVVEGRAPDPRGARNAPEFVALLGVLKEASGLTYRELAQRADAVGDVLPRSTIANMLGRTSVPREELLAAFVRACGCGPEEVADWLAVRKELAVHGERAGTGRSPGRHRKPPPGTRPSRPPSRSPNRHRPGAPGSGRFWRPPSGSSCSPPPR